MFIEVNAGVMSQMVEATLINCQEEFEQPEPESVT